MKTAIITLSAAILTATAPAVLARNVSSNAPHQHHQVSKKHPRVAGYAPWRVLHDNGVKMGYPGAWGYAPGAPKDYTYENSRNAGGGGGSGM